MNKEMGGVCSRVVRIGLGLLPLAVLPAGFAVTRAAAPPPGRPTPSHLCQTHRREAIIALRFSPSGKLVVSWSNHALTVWDAETGKPVLDLDLPFVKTVAFSHDSKLLALSLSNSEKAGAPGEVHVYDLTTKRRVAFLDGSLYGPDLLAFSPDRRLVVGSCRRRIVLWDLERQSAPRRLPPRPGDTNRPASMLFSPDGAQLLLSYPGSESSEIEILDLRSGKQLHLLPTPRGHSDPVRFGADGKSITYVESDGTVTTQCLTAGRRTSPAKFRLRADFLQVTGQAILVPHLLLAATADQDVVCLSDLRTGQLLWSIPPRDEEIRGRGFSTGNEVVSISPDGRWLASSIQDFAVEIWDLHTILGKDYLTRPARKKP
jgi:WD40 repeat protein